MVKFLSLDLRSRVLASISESASCRQAALRFGVSAASAVRWHGLVRTKGDAMPLGHYFDSFPSTPTPLLVIDKHHVSG